jgi:hypothetical protein
MTRHSFWVVVLIVGGASAFAVADPAAEKSSSDSAYPAQTALGQGVYDLTTVYARLGAAESTYAIAYTDLNLTVIRQEREFLASPEYKAAAAEVEQAHDALDAARYPVLEQLAHDPHYQDLAQRHVTVSMELEQGNLPARDVIDLAKSKMDYGSEMRLMEAHALSYDANVSAARARLIAGQKVVDDMREKFELTLYKTPEFAAAHAALDNAEVAVSAARLGAIGANITARRAERADFRRSFYNYQYGNFTYGSPYYAYGRQY